MTTQSKKVKVTWFVPDWMHERLKELAPIVDLSQSKLVTDALKRAYGDEHDELKIPKKVRLFKN